MEDLTIETTQPLQHRGEYVLASGPAAVERLFVLHRIYEPAGRRLLLKAGLKPGMHAVDFGCGVGAVTQLLSELVGPKGTVTGLDASELQIREAEQLCHGAGMRNVLFAVADACRTGLPRGEAGPALVGAGLISPAQLNSTLAEMEIAANDPDVLALAPRMSVVSARKAE